MYPAFSTCLHPRGSAPASTNSPNEQPEALCLPHPITEARKLSPEEQSIRSPELHASLRSMIPGLGLSVSLLWFPGLFAFSVWGLWGGGGGVKQGFEGSQG